MSNSLTKADLRILASASSKSRAWRLVRGLSLLIPLFWIAGALGDLSVAQKFAAFEGRSLLEVTALWYKANGSEFYSGLQVQAVKRVEAAFGKTLLALVFASLSVSQVLEQRRLARISALQRSLGWVADEGQE